MGVERWSHRQIAMYLDGDSRGLVTGKLSNCWWFMAFYWEAEQAGQNTASPHWSNRGNLAQLLFNRGLAILLCQKLLNNSTPTPFTFFRVMFVPFASLNSSSPNGLTPSLSESRWGQATLNGWYDLKWWKIRLDMVLKTAFFGHKKVDLSRWYCGPWRELWAPYGEDFDVKNGVLRLAPVFGIFFQIYQYHSLARPQITCPKTRCGLNRAGIQSKEGPQGIILGGSLPCNGGGGGRSSFSLPCLYRSEHGSYRYCRSSFPMAFLWLQWDPRTEKKKRSDRLWEAESITWVGVLW